MKKYFLIVLMISLNAQALDIGVWQIKGLIYELLMYGEVERFENQLGKDKDLKRRVIKIISAGEEINQVLINPAANQKDLTNALSYLIKNKYLDPNIMTNSHPTAVSMKLYERLVKDEAEKAFQAEQEDIERQSKIKAQKICALYQEQLEKINTKNKNVRESAAKNPPLKVTSYHSKTVPDELFLKDKSLLEYKEAINASLLEYGWCFDHSIKEHLLKKKGKGKTDVNSDEVMTFGEFRNRRKNPLEELRKKTKEDAAIAAKATAKAEEVCKAFKLIKDEAAERYNEFERNRIMLERKHPDVERVTKEVLLSDDTLKEYASSLSYGCSEDSLASSIQREAVPPGPHLSYLTEVRSSLIQKAILNNKLQVFKFLKSYAKDQDHLVLIDTDGKRHAFGLQEL